MYVLDTNVVSELRKARDKADNNVMAWASAVLPSALFLSVITIMELEQGIRLIERRDPIQAVTLRRWLEDNVLPAFAGRVLPIDIAVAQCCATLPIPDPRAKRDALIAATARVHGMVVVTRNVADFQPAGVPIINPWKPQSQQGE